MQTIEVVIETPKGSAQKYDYDPKKRFFKLKKVMPAGMVFPFDFGFIPDTRGQDGDPLDIIVISDLKSFPGCCMECRLIGAITAEQTEEGKTVRNDRFLSVPAASQLFSEVMSIDDLPDETIEQLEQFFVNYNKQEGKKFKPLGRISAKKAFDLIKFK